MSIVKSNTPQQPQLPGDHAKIVCEFIGYETSDYWWFHPDNRMPAMTKFIFKGDTSWDEFYKVYRVYRDKLNEIHKQVPQHSAVKGDSFEVDIHCGMMTIDLPFAYNALVQGIMWYKYEWVKTDTYKNNLKEIVKNGKQ